MKPKEKAKELFDKIYKLDNRAWYDTAKQCALIAVDEIIYVLDEYIDPVRMYWEEVKREIQAL